MELGIGSYTYTWAVGVPGSMPPSPMTATGLVDRAVELGVKLVQIADNLPLGGLAAGELDELESHAAASGVSIEVGTRGIARDHLERYLELAQRFGSGILRVVIDTASHKPTEDEIVETFAGFAPELERAGICLAIENHDRFKARTLARIVERIASPRVGICLDTVNSFGALEGPEAVLDALGPRVVNLHVKDFAIERAGHMMGFVVEGRPAGAGRLDVPWVLEQLRSHGRDPNAILELWTPPQPTLAETIAKEAEWASTSITYLRFIGVGPR
jgi:3-oxoisoapionate decarboxylase